MVLQPSQQNAGVVSAAKVRHPEDTYMYRVVGLWIARSARVHSGADLTTAPTAVVEDERKLVPSLLGPLSVDCVCPGSCASARNACGVIAVEGFVKSQRLGFGRV